MLSPFFELNIVFVIFWGLFFIQMRKKMPSYGKVELAVIYIFTRIVPVFMVFEAKKNSFINLGMEALIIAVVLYYTLSFKAKKCRSTIFALYLACPVIPLIILTGNQWYMLGALVSIIILFVLDDYVKKQGGSLLAFWIEYFVLGLGSLGFFYSKFIAGQNLDDDYPVILIFSLILLCGSSLVVIYRIGAQDFKYTNNSDELDKTNLTGKKIVDKEQENSTQKKEVEEVPEKTKDNTLRKNLNNEKRHLKILDICIIVLLTGIFAIMVFHKIGSHHTPETFGDYSVSDGSNQIILEFEDEPNISEAYIYLGNTGRIQMSFYMTNSHNPKWICYAENQTIMSAFAWNKVDVNYDIKNFDMLLLAGDARLMEVVFLDKQGNKVLPSNADEYPELFDEQSLFPEKATYFYGTMFDEVYHARTAYEFCHGLNIYETSHPPLGKIIISLGIWIFGMNPFGWRFMCGICGVLMIPLIYLFAFAMSKKTSVASFAAILLMTSFMNLSLSRIATIDIIVAFFVLLMFFFMYLFVKTIKENAPVKKQILFLVLTGISMGLSMATKWTGVYGALGIAIILFVFMFKYSPALISFKAANENKKYIVVMIISCILIFVVLALSIYVLSYIPFTKVYTDKGLIGHAIDNGKFMLSYHENTIFYHPYSSSWYEWLIDKMPLLDTYSIFENGKISSMSTFGNPLLLWGGLLVIFHQFYLWKCKKNYTALYLIIAYLSMLVPWLFIERTVFIYQYFICTIILVLMFANTAYHMKKKQKQFMIAIAGVSVVLFILFFPQLTANIIDREYTDKILEWMETWTFCI